MRIAACLPAALIVLLAACDKKPASPAGGAAGATPTVGPRPEKLPNGEPAVVTVKHVLIAFVGSQRSQATRSREEAEKLAFAILDRARNGEDFDKLMKDSDDPGAGSYTLVNEGISRQGDEFDRDGEKSEKGMVKGFGDACFRLEVGQTGLASYDPASSPFGYHVIKRIK